MKGAEKVHLPHFLQQGENYVNLSGNYITALS